MMIPKAPVAAQALKLDDHLRAAQHKAEGAEADPFDAVVAVLHDGLNVFSAEADPLAEAVQKGEALGKR